MLTPVPARRSNSSSINQNAIGETGGRYKTTPLYPGRFQGQLATDAEPRPPLGPFGTVHEVNNLMSFFNPNLPNPAAGGHLGALQFAGTAPAAATAKTPVDNHYRTSVLAWGRRIVSTKRPSCGRAIAVMYVHVRRVQSISAPIKAAKASSTGRWCPREPAGNVLEELARPASDPLPIPSAA